MKKIVFFIMLSLPFISTAVSGATWNEANGKKIIGVQVHDTGSFLVKFDSEVQNYCTPSGTDTIYFRSGKNSVTDEGIKALLSASLTALSTGFTVDAVHDNDADGYCFGRYLYLKK